MTGPEVEANFFTPYHIFTYLFIIFVIMVVYYQWQWARTCKNNIQVLVAQQGGGGDFFLAPKTGGEVSIKTPNTNTVRMWPVNELATIDVLYPGVGFVPAFLQKTIRLAIVNEGDWEPLLNRSRHREKVASPDIVTALEEIAKEHGGKPEIAINKILKGISTSPTREMIASPAVLGNLIQERISEAVASVAKDIMTPMNEAIKKLSQRINPWVVYIGLGLTVVLLAYLVIQVVPLTQGIIDIKDALGVK